MPLMRYSTGASSSYSSPAEVVSAAVAAAKQKVRWRGALCCFLASARPFVAGAVDGEQHAALEAQQRETAEQQREQHSLKPLSQPLPPNPNSTQQTHDTAVLAPLAQSAAALAGAGQLSAAQIRDLCVAFADLGFFDVNYKSAMAQGVWAGMLMCVGVFGVC